MARHIVTFADLVYIAKRTGVENWRGEDYTGAPVRGQVIAAPSSHRGQVGEMGTVVGPTRHHTGTPEVFKIAADYPTYQVVKEGRAGLSNSLSAYGLGRWYGIYVFSEDISYHAGAWSYAGITDGNGHFLGIEAEGTGGRWTPFQREFYPRLSASILLFVAEGADMMPRHADGAIPRGRKTDAANLPADFRAKVQGYLDDPNSLTYGGTVVEPKPKPEETDMMVVSVRVTGGTVPHAICGDRYFRIKENGTATQMIARGVPHITVGQDEHANFVAALSSERATLELPADDAPAA